MPDFSFDKAERLKSRKVIQSLFKRGKSFAQFPLRLVWLEIEERQGPYPARFALSVPKRKFKRAVDRNRIRRMVREAYRLNKHHLYRALQNEQQQIAFMLLYVAGEELPFSQIERAMYHLIRRFAKKYRKHH